MRRAWTFRRFLLPLAGALCLGGLTVAADKFGPPQPPPDVETLARAQNGALQPVRIAAVANQPAVAEPGVEDNNSFSAEPVLTDPLFPEPITAHPIQPNLYPAQGADPSPTVYQPHVPPPVAPLAPEQILPGVQSLQPIPAAEPYGWDTIPSCSTSLYVNGNGSEGNCVTGGCCVPKWTIRGEALIWSRNGGANVPLVNAPVVFNSGDLDSRWGAGPRLTFIRHNAFNSCWDLELSFFRVNGWNSIRVLGDADNYLTNPVIALPGVTALTSNYGSSLDSVELNVRRVASDWSTWFFGFRALQVEERLAADFGGVSSHAVSTNNQLYGVQVGLDVKVLERETWYINAVGKAGLYGNSVDSTTTTANLPGLLPLVVLADTQTSFVGEIGINTGYRLTNRFTVMAGYNLLWISGVALAPDQLAATNIQTGIGAINTQGSLFYHGVNIGAELTW